MKTQYLYLVVVLLLFTQCTKPNYINDYGEHLKIEFPEDLKMIYFDSHSDIQDFTNFSIYELTQNQTKVIQNQIKTKMCNSRNSNSCWERFGNFYSLKVTDSVINSGYYLEVVLITQEVNTLMIREIKL